MNRFKLSLSGLIDAVRTAVLPAAPPPFTPAPQTVRLRYRPLLGRTTHSLLQRLQNTVESESGTQSSGYALRTGAVWTVESVAGELHGTGGTLDGEPELRWMGVPTPADRQRVALMKAMPTPDMTIQTDPRGNFLGVSVRAFPEAVVAAMREAAPPGAEAQVEAWIQSTLDVERMNAIAHTNWFTTTGFFLGEPELEVGRTYSLAGSQQAVDGGPLPFQLEFGLDRIDGSPQVRVWLEEQLDVEALQRIARFQMARMAQMSPDPSRVPVPVPVSQSERNELHLDPETLHVSLRRRLRTAVSDVEGVGRITRIDELERAQTGAELSPLAD